MGKVNSLPYTHCMADDKYSTVARIVIPKTFVQRWEALHAGGKVSLLTHLLERAVMDDFEMGGNLIPHILMGVSKWRCTIQ